MSPLVITILVVSGIGLLIAIAYCNQWVERKKLETSRRKAELNDRIQRSSGLSDALPGQLMSPKLKLMLCRVQLHFVEELLRIDKKHQAAASRKAALLQQIAQGEDIALNNPLQAINSEPRGNEVRLQLETLHTLILRSAKDGALTLEEAKHWQAEIQHLLAQMNTELFSSLAKQALQNNQLGKARLALEQGVQQLRKQPTPERYQREIDKLQAQLDHVSGQLVELKAPEHEQDSELIGGLKSLESEDDWKKKSVYD